MAENAITGNAASIDGLTLNNTTPNRSTRSAFSTVAALNNSPTSVSQDLVSVADASGNLVTANAIDASGTFNANASTVTGVTDPNSSTPTFNGASAIIGRTVGAVLSSDITVGRDVVTADASGNTVDASGNTVLGDLTATATANGTSTSSATTAESAAAVVDLASVALQDSRVNVAGSARKLSFTAQATGNASASGVTVGSVSSNPSNANAAGIDGPNSILNLNVRGLSPQTNYFQDPISPFFADFGGLTTDPSGGFGSGLSAIGTVDASGIDLGLGGSAASFDASGGAALGTVAAEGQIYVVDASGGVNNGRLLFNASGDPLTSANASSFIDASGQLDASGAGFQFIDGNTAFNTASGNDLDFKTAVAGQLIDASGEVLFTNDSSGANLSFNTLNPATIPVAVTDASGNSVSIGGNGDIEATSQALGSSQAKNTTGDTNAFASVFSTGATLLGNVSIGGEGDVTGTSRVGVTAGQDTLTTLGLGRTNPVNPLVDNNGIIKTGVISIDGTDASGNATTFTAGNSAAIDTDSTAVTGSTSAISNLLSLGLGTSAVRDALPLTNKGNAGVGTSVDASGTTFPFAEPVSISIGTDGDVTGTARNVASTNSKTTTGEAVAFTGGLTTEGGNTLDFNPLGVQTARVTSGTDVTTAQLLGVPEQGNALTVGIFNADINGGGSHATGGGKNNVIGDAVSVFNTSASSTTGPANTGSSAITTGIFGADLNTANLRTDIVLGKDGSVQGYADSVNTTSSNTITGVSNAANASTTLGIANVNLDLNDNVDVTVTSRSSDRVTSKAITGNATADSGINTVGLFDSNVDIAQNGGVNAIAEATNTVKANAITGNASATSVANVVAIDNTPIIIGGNGSLTASASFTSTVG